MSLSEEGQRAAFAAWAASEGITKVGFNPVEAAGVTIGSVWGVRDHHLVLLDREWAIWVASQRSRATVEASPPAGEREAKIANERDRTVVARCVTAFDRAVAARGWLTQGRGPYEWDDDRFYAEFGHAIDEFRKAVEPLRRIAIDMTHVPKDDAGVADAKAAAGKLLAGGEEWGPCRKCGERVLVEGGGYRHGRYCASKATTRDADEAFDLDRLAKALDALAKRHDWAPLFNAPCQCEAHLEARSVLASLARWFGEEDADGIHDEHVDDDASPPPATVETTAPSVCPKCQGGGLVILADVPGEGRICGGMCACGARIGNPKEKPIS